MRSVGNYNGSSWAPAFRKDLIDIQPNTYDVAVESMAKQNIAQVKRERKPAVVEDRKDVERIFNYGK